MLEFSSEVASELQSYVYRLIDPRNGETFYVGKGKENRVFTHANGEISDDAEDGSKLDRIRKIKLAGFSVLHVIHRHGMNSETALEVEGALMDAYPGLTNSAGGHGNSERGVASAKELVEAYAAAPVVINHRVIEITINRTAAYQDVYTAVRFAWKLSKSNAENAELVLAVVTGMVVEVFIPTKWMPATKEYFPNRPDSYVDEPDRLGFVGKIAPDEIRNHYLRKRMPKKKRGAANPIRYFNP